MSLGVSPGVFRGPSGVAPAPPVLPAPPSGALWRNRRALAAPAQRRAPGSARGTRGDTRGTPGGHLRDTRGTPGGHPGPAWPRWTQGLSRCLHLDMPQHWPFILRSCQSLPVPAAAPWVTQPHGWLRTPTGGSGHPRAADPLISLPTAPV